MNPFNTNLIKPANFTEATRVLGKQGNARGFAEDTIVYLTHKSIATAKFENRKNLRVVGGTEEKPVRIYVESGMNTVEVVSGHVHIAPTSQWGNVVCANEGTTVTIEADESSKITLEGGGSFVAKTSGSTNRLRYGHLTDIKILQDA